MGRYREIRTGAELAKIYPHIVEEAIPTYGFGQRLNLIEAWITARLTRQQFGRWGRRRDGQDIAVWGFQEDATASAFRSHLESVLELTERQALTQNVSPGGRRSSRY